MTSIWLRILPYIAAVLLVIAALFGAYHHGVSVTNATWQAEWNARDTRDAEAKAVNETAERAREQAYQQIYQQGDPRWSTHDRSSHG